MSSDAIRDKLASVGQLPGLSLGLEKNVLLVRSGDISKDDFISKVESLQARVESLFEQSLPEAMDEEAYLVAQEYYDKASESLDVYLVGIDALLSWAETGQQALLDSAKLHFARGDRISKEVLQLGMEVQESFRKDSENVLRSVGGDPEGIG